MSNEVVTDEIRHYQEVRKRVGKGSRDPDLRISPYRLCSG